MAVGVENMVSQKRERGLEELFVEFLSDGDFRSVSEDAIAVVKNVILNDLGALVGGATSDGCETVLGLVKGWGGEKEATVLVHGGKFPAHNAVLVNSAMARALDIDDHMPPGMHLGASAVPTALAAAELAGGCTGEDFLTALALGFEMAVRINDASTYNGFDPSGVCGIFASVAAAGRVLRLNPAQMWNALALGFNRPIQTFQSIVDGTTAVRVGQGLISQAAMTSAQLARMGITGPRNFLEGVFGYFHLYAGDQYDPAAITAGLGERFHLDKISFKNYPSCGGTIASTDAILALMEKYHLTPEQVASIDVRVTPYTYDMTGGPLEIGDNPRVDAQFSIRYCVANALLRGGSVLRHFDEDQVRDTRILDLVSKIDVTADAGLEGPRQGSSLRADMDVTTVAGDTHYVSIPIPSGFAGNALSNERIVERFEEAVRYGGKPLPEDNLEKIVESVSRLEHVDDVRGLVALMCADTAIRGG
ncbi:MAG: MmgE/PrpD family protein [Actinobacteria bacterium]|nr:MmgE/PrpD family protein [Actinomycetota bacterium]